jgi:succinate dehydrogenase/fumarate reductase flavoprotein subunit
VYRDWVRHDHMQSRYSDRDLVRAFADENAATFEFLIENGVQFQDHLVGPTGASQVRRQQRTVQWPVASERVTHHPTRVGSGLIRALEKSARAKGVEVLLRHKMQSIVRESPSSGRVLGVTATHDGRTVNIRANKGVLVATGGSTSNVTLRRTFDPRLTEEYQVAGEPWSRQSGDGELAAMAVGASLWGTANQTCEQGIAISKTRHIGCQWGYSSLIWQTDSRIFDLARASGLTVIDWQDLILVNQTGRRFWNEVDARYDFFAAAMAWSGDENKLNGGGPIWAIFDQDAVEREEWDPKPPNVDPEYFFRGDTLAELAGAIKNPYQSLSMSGATLEETVARYNSFVDLGQDEDFDKPTPRYKIERPPFYAAWSTPILHDSLTGLRTNTKAQVIDMRGQVIPGLYCAGESQGGFAQHGLGRCLVFGRIAGRDAALNGGMA